MLAGLLFATHDAEDRPGTLAATLPFGGLTLIEYQARLLAALGAAQLIVVVQRLTPELLGALARIGRRGLTVDAVRSAGEAAAKLHPLARILMLADGLVTTATIAAPLAGEGGDALLVADGTRVAGFERLGGSMVWAGIARLVPARMAEVAAMPRDYDIQSSLLRLAAQAGAKQLPLTETEAHTGHGIERSAAALDARGRAVMTATLASRRGWFDHWIVAPLARPLLGEMMQRRLPTAALAAVAGGSGAIGLLALFLGNATVGMIAALLGTITAAAGRTIAWLRDETILARGFDIAVLVLPALAALMLGHDIDAFAGSETGIVLAATLVVIAALDARAADIADRADWQGGAGGYLFVVTLLTVIGWPISGLAVGAAYAAASLAGTIETFRRET